MGNEVSMKRNIIKQVNLLKIKPQLYGMLVFEEQVQTQKKNQEVIYMGTLTQSLEVKDFNLII